MRGPWPRNLPPNYDPASWTVTEVDVQPWVICLGNDTNSTENNPNYCNPSQTPPQRPFDEERIIERGLALLEQGRASNRPVRRNRRPD